MDLPQRAVNDYLITEAMWSDQIAELFLAARSRSHPPMIKCPQYERLCREGWKYRAGHRCGSLKLRLRRVSAGSLPGKSLNAEVEKKPGVGHTIHTG